MEYYSPIKKNAFESARVREPGTGRGIGSPDGAAQLQVDPGVGRGAGRICSQSPPGTLPPVSMRVPRRGARAGGVCVGEKGPRLLLCTRPTQEKADITCLWPASGRIRGSRLEGRTAYPHRPGSGQDRPTARTKGTTSLPAPSQSPQPVDALFIPLRGWECRHTVGLQACLTVSVASDRRPWGAGVFRPGGQGCDEG